MDGRMDGGEGTSFSHSTLTQNAEERIRAEQDPTKVALLFFFFLSLPPHFSFLLNVL